MADSQHGMQSDALIGDTLLMCFIIISVSTTVSILLCKCLRRVIYSNAFDASAVQPPSHSDSRVKLDVAQLVLPDGHNVLLAHLVHTTEPRTDLCVPASHTASPV
jgi:hypothetical protein